MIGHAWRLTAKRGLPIFDSVARVDLRMTCRTPSGELLRLHNDLATRIAGSRRSTTVKISARGNHTSLSSRSGSAPDVTFFRNHHQRRSFPWQTMQSRSFLTESLPNALVPPAVFIILLLTLWTYKCVMTVLFQNKIIYMPYMPPGARSESLDDYTSDCKPVKWEQKNIKSLDGTNIALCIGSLPLKQPKASRHVVICYFQGNGSAPPPRLPLLSNVLKSIETQIGNQSQTLASDVSVHFTMVAVAYRGYWKSSGRPSQPGIEKDAQALLQWANSTYASPNAELQLVLWGQSIGAAVASIATSEYVQDSNCNLSYKAPISGLILETPFSSIKSMLIALYPQKWLPYRYLWPFLWNFWDSEAALRRIAEAQSRFKILLISATRDEVVPPGEADKLEILCREMKLETERKKIIGALHTEATTRREGQFAVARFAIEVSARFKRDDIHISQ